jgi:hypothetical protein
MFPTLARLAFVAVALAACNGSDAAVPDPSPTPTVAVTATPTAAPSPEPSPTEVLPANDVEDPVEALEAIVRFRDFLFEHPDPDKLSLIYAERCDCYDEVFEVLVQLQNEDRRTVFEAPRNVRETQLEESQGPVRQVAYEVDSPKGAILDTEGEVVLTVSEVGTFAGHQRGLRDGR